VGILRRCAFALYFLEMAAFGAAAAAAYGALVYWLGLRLGRGGWRAVHRARRGTNPDLNWTDLATIEKGAFYGVPLFGAAALGFLALGIVLVATGHA
jgi:hypothetical protein